LCGAGGGGGEHEFLLIASVQHIAHLCTVSVSCQWSLTCFSLANLWPFIL